MVQERLTELETRYSFLERHVEDLSSVLREQQRTIDLLLARLKRLESVVTETLDQVAGQPAQEKPPHY